MLLRVVTDIIVVCCCDNLTTNICACVNCFGVLVVVLRFLCNNHTNFFLRLYDIITILKMIFEFDIKVVL